MRWNEQGVELRVAINVSARVLQDAEFPARLKRLLHEAAVRPEQVELEITESAMLVDPERAKQIVKELHGLGVLIAIDDYGTGFSSLGYLRDLRVHSLKLDKSFVVDLETREQNRVIVESTAQMAHALGPAGRRRRRGDEVGRGLPALDRLRPGAGLPVRAADAGR